MTERAWVGSDLGEFAEGPIPPERWPYGPPEAHQRCCMLFLGGTYCDCEASDESAQ